MYAHLAINDHAHDHCSRMGDVDTRHSFVELRPSHSIERPSYYATRYIKLTVASIFERGKTKSSAGIRIRDIIS